MYIGLAAVFVALIGVLLAFHRHKTSISNQMTDERIKMQNQINNNALKILVVEKDIMEIKRSMVADFKELRKDFTESMTEFTKQNREDHRALTERLDEAVRGVTRAATLIESHVNGNKPKNE